MCNDYFDKLFKHLTITNKPSNKRTAHDVTLLKNDKLFTEFLGNNFNGCNGLSQYTS